MFALVPTMLCRMRSKLSAVVLCLFAVSCGDPTTGSLLEPYTAKDQEVIRVVTSGGFAAAYNLLAPQFETETGLRLVTHYGSSSGGAPDSIPMRLARGEVFDVVILSAGSLANLTEKGAVLSNGQVALVESKIGMAVKQGAYKPDISSEEAFAETLLKAKSIGFSASASGTYLSQQLWPRMKLWQALENKSLRIQSERVASVVARGDVEIGFQQISEILPISGADYVGPIPESLQKVTVFSAGITRQAKNPDGAARLLAYLSSEKVAATVASTGLDPISAATVSQ